MRMEITMLSMNDRVVIERSTLSEVLQLRDVQKYYFFNTIFSKIIVLYLQ